MHVRLNTIKSHEKRSKFQSMCLSQSPISIPRLMSSVFYSVCFSQTHSRRNSGAKISFSFHFDDAYRSVFQPPRDDFRALHPKISTKSVCMRRRKTIRCECVNRKQSSFNILSYLVRFTRIIPGFVVART